MSIQPRLFADMAATPTARERSEIRRHWESLSPTIFDTVEPDDTERCHACGGEHADGTCGATAGRLL